MLRVVKNRRTGDDRGRIRPVPRFQKIPKKNGAGRGGMDYNSGVMSEMNEKTADQLRDEFYESLRREA